MAEILSSPRTAATTTAAKMFGRCSDRVQNVFRRCAEGAQKVVQRIKNSATTTAVKIGAPAQQVIIEMKEIHVEVIPVSTMSCGDHISCVELLNKSSSITSNQLDVLSQSSSTTSQPCSTNSSTIIQTQKVPSIWHQRHIGSWIWVLDVGHQSPSPILVGCAGGVDQLSRPDIPSLFLEVLKPRPGVMVMLSRPDSHKNGSTSSTFECDGDEGSSQHCAIAALVLFGTLGVCFALDQALPESVACNTTTHHGAPISRTAVQRPNRTTVHQFLS